MFLNYDFSWAINVRIRSNKCKKVRHRFNTPFHYWLSILFLYSLFEACTLILTVDMSAFLLSSPVRRQSFLTASWIITFQQIRMILAPKSTAAIVCLLLISGTNALSALISLSLSLRKYDQLDANFARHRAKKKHLHWTFFAPHYQSHLIDNIQNTLVGHHSHWRPD